MSDSRCARLGEWGCRVGPWLLGLLLIAVFPNMAVAASNGGTIHVTVGQTRVVDTPHVKRVAVGNGALVGVTAFQDTQQVLLIGKKPGVTDMYVWSRTGEQTHYLVKVGSGKNRLSMQDVKAVLGAMPGVEISQLSNGDILVQGVAKRAVDFARVAMLAKSYPGVINQVIKPKVNLKPTIRVSARVLEVKRSTMKNLGIDWDDTLNGPTFGLINDFVTNSLVRPVVTDGLGTGLPLDAGTQTFLGINTRLDSLINILATSNNARILSEPRVSVISGEEAKFLVGGEVPIPTTNANGSTNVEFKQYGVILKIRPVADRDGFIRTKVSVEVSSIDNSVIVNGVPGFRTRRTETEMNAHDGQTLVISGLLSSIDSKAVEKIPFLGDIPILGELFKSRQFRRNRTELVVMVTPEIISPESPENLAAIRAAEQLAKSSLDETYFSIFD